MKENNDSTSKKQSILPEEKEGLEDLIRCSAITTIEIIIERYLDKERDKDVIQVLEKHKKIISNEVKDSIEIYELW